MGRVKAIAAVDGRPVHAAVRCTRGDGPTPMELVAAGTTDGIDAVELWRCTGCQVTTWWVRGYQLPLPLEAEAAGPVGPAAP